MKRNTIILVISTILYLSVIKCTETQVIFKFKFSVILNAVGNVMTLIAQLFAILSVNHQNVILAAPNQRMQFVMLNVKNQNAKYLFFYNEIKCPDKGCEMFDCPKCVTVCKQPHCVTHCQVIYF
jgi:hypothetical protein